MVVILDIEVLEQGPMVGEKIGNPATIGSDGRVRPSGKSSTYPDKFYCQVPPPNDNQNTNPNAGGGAATAPKRPSENTSRQGPPAKAPAPSAVRSSIENICANGIPVNAELAWIAMFP